ncbi:hypothetical protein Q3G72_017029 [Acer saccharum]|nr:hypothetical protein Q3G72_017029 [Acer saccharum]
MAHNTWQRNAFKIEVYITLHTMVKDAFIFVMASYAGHILPFLVKKKVKVVAVLIAKEHSASKDWLSTRAIPPGSSSVSS